MFYSGNEEYDLQSFSDVATVLLTIIVAVIFMAVLSVLVRAIYHHKGSAKHHTQPSQGHGTNYDLLITIFLTTLTFIILLCLMLFLTGVVLAQHGLTNLKMEWWLFLVMLVLYSCMALICWSAVSWLENRWGVNNFVIKLSYCLLVTFIVSLAWEHVRLYQEYLADQEATYIKDIPEHCISNSPGFLSNMMIWFQDKLTWKSSRETCMEYIRDRTVDPFFKVSPIKVISSLLTRVVVEHIESLFYSLGRCVSQFFSQIPVQYQLPLGFFICVLIMFILILICGYRLKVGVLFSLAPTRPASANRSNFSVLSPSPRMHPKQPASRPSKRVLSLTARK